MNPVEVEKLDRNLFVLIRDMDPIPVVDYLITSSTFLSSHYNEIERQTTTDDKNRVLLQILKKRGESAYENFIRALNATQQHQLADMLNQTQQASHTKTNEAAALTESSASKQSTILKKFEERTVFRGDLTRFLMELGWMHTSLYIEENGTLNATTIAETTGIFGFHGYVFVTLLNASGESIWKSGEQLLGVNGKILPKNRKARIWSEQIPLAILPNIHSVSISHEHRPGVPGQDMNDGTFNDYNAHDNMNTGGTSGQQSTPVMQSAPETAEGQSEHNSASSMLQLNHGSEGVSSVEEFDASFEMETILHKFDLLPKEKVTKFKRPLTDTLKNGLNDSRIKLSAMVDLEDLVNIHMTSVLPDGAIKKIRSTPHTSDAFYVFCEALTKSSIYGLFMFLIGLRSNKQQHLFHILCTEEFCKELLSILDKAQ